jgi:hypothetical protein
MMSEENDNQHHQLFLLKGQAVVSSADGNGKKINLNFFYGFIFYRIN